MQKLRMEPRLVLWKCVLFRQDNTKPHAARKTSNQTEELDGVEVLPCPAYSPDCCSIWLPSLPINAAFYERSLIWAIQWSWRNLSRILRFKAKSFQIIGRRSWKMVVFILKYFNMAPVVFSSTSYCCESLDLLFCFCEAHKILCGLLLRGSHGELLLLLDGSRIPLRTICQVKVKTFFSFTLQICRQNFVLIYVPNASTTTLADIREEREVIKSAEVVTNGHRERLALGEAVW